MRIDRPTLDSRFINGKAPDILIYSKQKNFDKNIPLFKIPNRKVFISDDLEIIKNYKFIMVEGGENFYQQFKNIVNWNLFIVNQNKMIKRENFKLSENINTIYIDKKEDLFIYFRGMEKKS